MSTWKPYTLTIDFEAEEREQTKTFLQAVARVSSEATCVKVEQIILSAVLAVGTEKKGVEDETEEK